MSLKTKAKETIVENLVKSGLVLIGLLALVLWSSVPTRFWEAISEAIDKRVLWAVVALLFLAVIGETIFILQSHIQSRRTLHHFGGVLWNANCDFFCPKDETPLFQASRTESDDGKSVEIFQCPKCDSDFIFKTPEGVLITAAQAKKNFLMQQALGKKGSIVLPVVVEGINDCMRSVLEGFAGTTSKTLRAEHFTGILKSGVKPVVIAHSLDKLHKKGLLKRITYSSDHSDGFQLTEQGREYIVENNII